MTRSRSLTSLAGAAAISLTALALAATTKRSDGPSQVTEESSASDGVSASNYGGSSGY